MCRVVLALGLALFASLGVSLAAAPDCTATRCVFVPLALKPASGIDNDSAKDLSAAGKLMQSCGEKIKDVMPELQALQQ